MSKNLLEMIDCKQSIRSLFDYEVVLSLHNVKEHFYAFQKLEAVCIFNSLLIEYHDSSVNFDLVLKDCANDWVLMRKSSFNGESK